MSPSPWSCEASTSTSSDQRLDHRCPDEHAGNAARRPSMSIGLEESRSGGRSRCGGRSRRSGRGSSWSASPVEDLVGEHDQPGAGAQARSSRRRASSPAVGRMPDVVEQVGDRRGLAAGHDDRRPGRRVVRRCAPPRRPRRRARASRCVRVRRPEGRGRQRAPRLPAAFGEIHVERGDLARRSSRRRDRSRPWPRCRRHGSGWSPRRWPWPCARGRRS